MDYRTGDEVGDVGGLVVLAHTPPHIRVAGEVQVLEQHRRRSFRDLQSDGVRRHHLHVALLGKPHYEVLQHNFLVRPPFRHLSLPRLDSPFPSGATEQDLRLDFIF